MKERVLLTGATGFLGYNIARALIERSYEVVASVRSDKNSAYLTEMGCKIKLGNLENEKFVDEIVKNTDYIIHCASFTGQFQTDFEIYRKANVVTTQKLVQAAKRYQIKRFILVSTANCFTNGTLANPGIESSEFMPFLKDSNYAYSKYLAQKLVLDEFRKSNFPVVVVAPTFLIGEFDRKPSSGKLMLYLSKNRIIVYPSKAGKNFVDVFVAAKATVNALVMGELGEVYLLAGENKTYISYFREIVSLVKMKHKKYFIPIPFVLIKVFMEMLRLIPAKRSRLLRANLKLLFSENYFSNQKAVDELDMEPTHLRQTIIKTINWFRENNYLSNENKAQK
ncbi:MAG: NAD-dependent epimerase/dehydratase family protein [Moheibacter sp.]